MRGKPKRNVKRLSGDAFINKQEMKKKAKVETMNVNKPISYEEFKQLNEEFKKLYISHLMNTYGASTYEIAIMMGTTSKILCKYLYRYGINAKSLKISVSKDTLDTKGWKKFVKGELGHRLFPKTKRLQRIIETI